MSMRDFHNQKNPNFWTGVYMWKKEGPGKLTWIPGVVWISNAKFNWTNTKQTRRCEQIFHVRYLYSCKHREEIRLKELVLSPLTPDTVRVIFAGETHLNLHSKTMLGCLNPNLGQIWTNPNVGSKMSFQISTQLQLSLFNPTFGFVQIWVETTQH